jgi:hypothetical protein
MDARFLRDEAARFRGMAEDADREATKLRLLAMAADYEARAGRVNELAEPGAPEAHQEAIEPNLDGAVARRDEPNPGETAKARPVRKTATGLKETVLVARRPAGRPKRE